MHFEDKYPDLIQVVKGTTWKNLFDWLYWAGRFLDFNEENLIAISGNFLTVRKIAKLIEAQYFTLVSSDYVFEVTGKTREMLEAEGYDTKDMEEAHLIGVRGKHKRERSKVLIKIMKEPPVCFAFTYDFGFLQPESVYIEKKENAYKITFLKDETENTYWSECAKNKRFKDKKQAGYDEIYYKWWKVWSEKLGLPFCRRNEISFSVFASTDLTTS